MGTSQIDASGGFQSSGPNTPQSSLFTFNEFYNSVAHILKDISSLLHIIGDEHQESNTSGSPRHDINPHFNSALLDNLRDLRELFGSGAVLDNTTQPDASIFEVSVDLPFGESEGASLDNLFGSYKGSSSTEPGGGLQVTQGGQSEISITVDNVDGRTSNAFEIDFVAFPVTSGQPPEADGGEIPLLNAQLAVYDAAGGELLSEDLFMALVGGVDGSSSIFFHADVITSMQLGVATP